MLEVEGAAHCVAGWPCASPRRRVAASQPDGLSAILTHVAPSNMEEQLVYPGGALADADLAWPQGPTSPEQPAYADRQRDVWREHPLYDEYWQDLDLGTPGPPSRSRPSVSVGGTTSSGWERWRTIAVW
jgi:hypothetical protein